MATSQQKTLSEFINSGLTIEEQTTEQTEEQDLDHGEDLHHQSGVSEGEFRRAQKRLGVGVYDDADALDDEEWASLFERNEERVDELVDWSAQRS